jgi:hypothetical protein
MDSFLIVNKTLKHKDHCSIEWYLDLPNMFNEATLIYFGAVFSHFVIKLMLKRVSSNYNQHPLYKFPFIIAASFQLIYIILTHEV